MINIGGGIPNDLENGELLNFVLGKIDICVNAQVKAIRKLIFTLFH